MVCYFSSSLSQPFYLSAEGIVLPSFFSLSQVVFAPERFAIECFVSGLSGFVALQEPLFIMLCYYKCRLQYFLRFLHQQRSYLRRLFIFKHPILKYFIMRSKYSAYHSICGLSNVEIHMKELNFADE